MERNYKIYDKEILAIIRKLVLDIKHTWKRKLFTRRL